MIQRPVEPCPECGSEQTFKAELLDGAIYNCQACGHQEYENVGPLAQGFVDAVTGAQRVYPQFDKQAQELYLQGFILGEQQEILQEAMQ